MVALPESLKAWNRGSFDAVFKSELPRIGKALPLQEGLTSGSYALESPLDVVILQKTADDETIRVKASIFYQSLMPGCACAGDPTVEDTQNEHITMLVSINRKTAEAVFQCLED
ncbi:hypothetical protein P4C99_04160 [Pontiellaceae bacterium B1224]|nr:hypothetical protein [Pontiellaceae bacterium B1224]